MLPLIVLPLTMISLSRGMMLICCMFQFFLGPGVLRFQMRCGTWVDLSVGVARSARGTVGICGKRLVSWDGILSCGIPLPARALPCLRSRASVVCRLGILCPELLAIYLYALVL